MTIILLFILYLLITNPNLIANEIVIIFELWYKTILPTMYPSFVVIDMIESMPLVTKISKLLFKPFKLIFNISSSKSVLIIIISLLCGAPASTKIIENSFENKEISENEYQNLLCCFSTLSLPFTVMILTKAGISIALYYLLYLILASIWMHIFNKKSQIAMDYGIYNINYIELFLNSIKKNIQIVINILGILIVFRVIIKLIIKDDLIIYPYLEILGGLAILPNNFILLSSLGFLGFSIHLQILSVAKQFKYSKFLFARLFFCLLSLLGFLY